MHTTLKGRPCTGGRTHGARPGGAAAPRSASPALHILVVRRSGSARPRPASRTRRRRLHCSVLRWFKGGLLDHECGLPILRICVRDCASSSNAHPSMHPSIESHTEETSTHPCPTRRAAPAPRPPAPCALRGRGTLCGGAMRGQRKKHETGSFQGCSSLNQGKQQHIGISALVRTAAAA